MKTRQRPIPTTRATLIAIAFGIFTAATDANPYVDINPFTDHLSLEARIDFSPDDELYVADLWDNGSESQIDVYRMSAGPSGTMVLNSDMALDSGQLFGVGDWCWGPDYGAFPYIAANGGSFDIRVGGYMVATDTTATTTISDSLGDRYTSTDCSTLDNGDFIISAQNFDTGEIDYFRSADQGLNWNLSASYSLSTDLIIGPFDGYRPTSGAVGDAVGTTYQRDDGLIQAALVDPLTGTASGTVDIFNHADDIGSGLVLECDGLLYDIRAYGLCNSGDDVWGGSIDTTDGGLWTVQLNDVSPGSSLSFFGVSVSAGFFDGQTQFHNFSNQHVVTPLEGTTWGTSFSVPSYPYGSVGGPVDSVTSDSMGRIYVAGNAEGGSSGASYLAMATVDPSLIEAPVQTAGGATIPLLTPATLVLLALLLAFAGAHARRGA